MSGDVQPRKRKDKRRRKDDFDPVPVQVHPPVFANNSLSDDVNIHVHKDGGTGGNICAKLVFFMLFSALIVLIGLIITEHRGLTDLDSADTESRFSHIFEGLVDSGRDAHDHEDPGIEEALDDHEENEEESNVSEPEDEEEPISEEDDKSGGDDHSEENSIEEEDIQADELEEENDSAVSEEQEGEDIQNDEDEDDLQAEDDEVLEDDDEEIEETVEESEENYQGVVNSEEVDEDRNEVGSKGSEEAEDDGSEGKDGDDEGDYNNESEENDDQAVDNDNDEAEDNDNEVDEKEVDRSDEEDNAELIKSKREISVETNDEEPAASSEDVSEETTKEDDLSEDKVVGEEIVDKTETEAERAQSDQDENIQESSGLAVKLGVGVAILVVAHLVLVRKWRNADDTKPSLSKEQKEAVPDLSRRNTIVPPPSYQEIEPDLENAEEDYSEEEFSEEDEPVEPKSLKAKYQELRATYSRSLTPESDPDHGKSPKPYEYEDEENVDEEEEEEISEEEDEDDYENEEEYDEDDDEELLTRLEAKYGKIQGVDGNLMADNASKRIDPPKDMVEDTDSDRQSDDEEYKNMNITNKSDFQIRNEIDEAQKSVRHNPSYAVQLFDAILRKHPSSPRSLYGKAISLDALADEKQSNTILEKALAIYTELLQREDVLPVLYKMVAERCINRTRFMGQYKKLVMVHLLVIKRFPDDPKHKNDLAVTYLTMNRIEDARSVFKDVLKRWPNDGYALVHYGFILKTADNKLEEAVHYFRKGFKTQDEGVKDGRFYFHLGDALTRLGRTDEANKVYEEGARNHVFLSKYQRSLYNVPRLTGKPWWPKEDLQNPLLINLLEHHWKEIATEGLAVLNEKNIFQDESENLKNTGDWKQFELFARGRKNAKNCRKCPITCGIIDRIPEARSCKRGQTKFSVMHPGTHVWPHCGPTNCRLRAHLGLRVPQGTFIRVADQTRSWEEGALIVFDDSFEHEVWHNGTGFRLVLIVDIWHPELTPYEKKSLSPI